MKNNSAELSPPHLASRSADSPVGKSYPCLEGGPKNYRSTKGNGDYCMEQGRLGQVSYKHAHCLHMGLRPSCFAWIGNGGGSRSTPQR